VDHEAVHAAVADAIREQLGLAATYPITPATRLLEELGLDSLRALFLISDLEARLQIDLSSLSRFPATVKELTEECTSGRS
jgi:acyl carrier protein